MKEKSKVENLEELQNIEISEKAVKLSELGKEYIINSVDDELTQEEAILRSTEVGPEEKKVLVKSLKRVDEVIMKPTDAGISTGKAKLKKEMAKELKRDTIQQKESRETTMSEIKNTEKSREER